MMRSALVRSGRWLARSFGNEPLHAAAAVLLDVLVLAAAYAVALLLRFDGNVPRESAAFTAKVFPAIALLYVAANAAFGVYRTVWAYGSLGDVVNLFRPVAAVTLLIFVANAWVHERDLPLSVVLTAGALTFPGMAVVKMRTRLVAHLPWGDVASRRLLIVGAGETGQLLARELQNRPASNYQPIGFLDNDPKKLNTRIHGLRVLGTDADLERIVREYDVDMVAIATPGAPGSAIRRIVAACQRVNVPVRIVPSVDHWVLGGRGDALRELTLDDLLGREPVEVDVQRCAASVRDKSVLVTGAAGSIGSELCRQLLAFQPRELHLLDNNESGLYDLSLELAPLAPQTALRLWVGDIADVPTVERVFREARPQVVYHAAALKHVPLMEEHPDQAFRVNVFGTLAVARAARAAGAERFVLISTDKAVRPASVMGATKRIAELIVAAFARTADRTSFVAVRFGNVMGSRGSVVPTFLRQIERGGPVTVMHPDMMRYFITIPEAVSLVIQAGAFGGRGSVYMLDMGEEVSILELAERMIRLRGLQPGEDIQVVFTGPRPGEKLREELVADFERLEPTDHPKVMRVVADLEVDERELLRLIEECAAAATDLAELRRRIYLIVRRFDGPGDGEPAPQPVQAQGSER
ncbi:UDP-N-acetyl-alpha-D-glucosamine C6 dehydratase [bacterium HR29]|jgi:FlaA1/EpsC-like NDP-sugar epimerase|nr:UDP-N-acetyl-alpha-D-glucosamine C6 dehydratase [bacterium HR29]